MTIDQAFDKTVAYYDDWMRKALPGYGDLFAVATEVMPFERDAPIRVLDLGAGTGLFSQHVLQRYPNATFVLYDVAAKMLDEQQIRLLLGNEATRNPLFLIVALEELRGFGSFEQLNRKIAALPKSGDTLTAVFQQVIRRLGEDFNAATVKDVLTLLEQS